MGEIFFYGTRGEFGIFSNFFRLPSPLRLDEKLWPTTEHYFQAQKFIETDLEWAVQIEQARTPGQAAKMGRSRSHPLRKDWERVKDDVMRQCVRQKFVQFKHLRAVLLGTGDAILVEHTVRDRYWADGGDGTGKNMLGKILMEVREELRGGDGGEEA